MTNRKKFDKILEIKPQLIDIFSNFSYIHDEGGGRFPNFSLHTVTWAINRSNILFYIPNEDNSVRSFIMLGSESEFCCESRIEMIAGELSDFKVLLKKVKQYASSNNTFILSVFLYRSEELYNIFKESGFEPIISITDSETGRVNFTKFQIILENRDYIVKNINN